MEILWEIWQDVTIDSYQTNEDGSLVSDQYERIIPTLLPLK